MQIFSLHKNRTNEDLISTLCYMPKNISEIHRNNYKTKNILINPFYNYVFICFWKEKQEIDTHFSCCFLFWENETYSQMLSKDFVKTRIAISKIEELMTNKSGSIIHFSSTIFHNVCMYLYPAIQFVCAAVSMRIHSCSTALIFYSCFVFEPMYLCMLRFIQTVIRHLLHLWALIFLQNIHKNFSKFRIFFFNLYINYALKSAVSLLDYSKWFFQKIEEIIYFNYQRKKYFSTLQNCMFT